MNHKDYFIRKHITATIDTWHKEYQGSVFQNRLTFSEWVKQDETPVETIYRRANELVKPDYRYKLDKAEVRTVKLNRFTGSEQELNRQTL